MWITVENLCKAYLCTCIKPAAVSRMNLDPTSIRISEYTYPLSQDRIAHFPLKERDQSKLLVYQNGTVTDARFFELPDLLPSSTKLVLNNTRVIEARIFFQKPTGGVIEIFCLEPYGVSIEAAMQMTGKVLWNCFIGGASKWKPGQVLQKELTLREAHVLLTARYIKKEEDSFVIELEWQPSPIPFVEVIHAAGSIPLPPYIKRELTKEDQERYQTIFGRYEGSVAAPTAALHFTNGVFARLAEKDIRPDFITLHVGAGTFKPVKTETIGGHQMHTEPFTVSKTVISHLLQSSTRVAVGTTTLRTLESLYWMGVKLKYRKEDPYYLGQWEAYELRTAYPETDTQEALHALLQHMEREGVDHLHCRTGMLIAPGYAFHLPSGLITNFHQPQSTLLLLIAAFIGEDWKKVYQHALDNDYRFLSYGDSSLLWRNK
jgi:S-adenosylmethionine:tRNA ribosyltransferase-isomerase